MSSATHWNLKFLALLLVIYQTSDSFTVAIFGKIRVSPTEASFNPGDNVTLNCSVEQDGPADLIFWYKDDWPIGFYRESNASQWAQVSIIDVTHKDAGTYRCIVKKGSQCDADVFDVHVNAIPKIKGVPRRVRAMEGEDKKIDCKADGWPTPTLRWISNETGAIGQEDNRFDVIILTRKLVLKIRSASESHEGYYTCIATNAFGEDRHTVRISVILKGEPKEPEIKVENNFVIAKKGSNITLDCLALHTVWTLAHVLWKYNGTEIKKVASHYLLSTVTYDHRMTLALKILNVSERDGGNYVCEVLTPLGFDRNNITVIVEDEGNLQNISTRWKIVAVKTTTEVKLQCIASYPKFVQAEMWWIFNGRQLNESDSHHRMELCEVRQSGLIRTDSMSLWINNVSDADFGNYSCVVNTSLGTSMEAILLVETNAAKDRIEDGEGNSTVLVLLFPLLALRLLISIIVYILFRKVRRKESHHILREKASDGGFVYDVFVTFSNKDRHWVTDKLMPLLERQRLKCCIHSRDFELGRALVDNMAESVYSSRKVLAVLSQNYMDSKFCRGELDMALHRNKAVRDCSLLVIRIDSIPKHKLPKPLRKKTFLDFHEYTDRSGFERRLMRFLVHPENNHKLNNTVL